MTKHGRQHHSERRGLNRGSGRKLGIECLERRTLMSAMGVLPAWASGASPAAFVADARLRSTDRVDLGAENMTTLRNASLQPAADTPPVAPPRGDDASHRSAADQSLVSSPFNPAPFGPAPASPMPVPGTTASPMTGAAFAPSSTSLTTSITTFTFDSPDAAVSLTIVTDTLSTTNSPMHGVDSSPAAGSASDDAAATPPAASSATRHPDAPTVLITYEPAHGNAGQSSLLPDLLVGIGSYFSDPPQVAPPIVAPGPPSQSLDTPAPPSIRVEPASQYGFGVAAAGRLDESTAGRTSPSDAGLVAAEGIANTPTTVGLSSQATFRENLADAAQSNVSEGGIVSLDDGTASSIRVAANGIVAADNDTSGVDPGGLPGDPSQGAQKASGKAADGNNAAAGKALAAARLRRGQAMSPRALDSTDDGTIDLLDPNAADAVPDAADSAAVAAGSADRDASDSRPESRPESSVALFCDMEIAVGDMPGDTLASAAIPIGSGTSAAAGVQPRATPAATSQEAVRRANPRQHVLAAPAGRVPLVAGAALVTVAGGLWVDRGTASHPQQVRARERRQIVSTPCIPVKTDPQ